MNGKHPSHDALQAIEWQDGETKKTKWQTVGAAWPHKDGKGFSITINAFPIDGRLHLRERTQENKEASPPDKYILDALNSL